MRLNHATPIVLAFLFAFAGCSRSNSANVTDSTATVASPTAESVTTDSTKADTSITVTANGYGPLRIGMTVANAATALKSPAPSMAGLDTACAYAHIDNAPSGMRIMVTGGTVARIEVDSSSIATGLGARVGDPESRIHELYGSRVTVQPHKYLPNGRYLIVSSIAVADSGLKLVFESDGTRVTKYRAGRMPEVEWVEGCS